VFYEWCYDVIKCVVNVIKYNGVGAAERIRSLRVLKYNKTIYVYIMIIVVMTKLSILSWINFINIIVVGP